MGKWARKAALLAAVSLLAMAGAAHAETRLSFTAGLEYSSGEYGGTETTEVVAAPFGVRLTVDDWTFRASSAYMQVSGPADISEDGEAGGSGPIARDQAAHGVADTTVSLERAFRRIGGSNAYVEVTARARLPSGDEERGFGVGTVDYGVVTEIGVSSEDGGAFVSAGYRFLGKRDEGPDRQDGMQAGVGAWLPVGGRGRVGVFGNWRKASVEDGDDPSQAGGYISYRMSERLRVTFAASGGLSDASPEYTAGIRFNWLPGGLNN